MIYFSNIVLSNSNKPLLLLYTDDELIKAKINKHLILGRVTLIFNEELLKKAKKLTNIYTIRQLDTDRLYNEIHSLSYEIKYNDLDYLNVIYKHMTVEEYSVEDKMILLTIFDKTITHLTNKNI
jgi:hypothetical protein